MKAIACFDKHREDGKVASVRLGNRWFDFREVRTTPGVTLHSVYKGRGARQPVFFFETDGDVIIQEANGVGWLAPA